MVYKPVKKWTRQEFLGNFKDIQKLMPERRFCFIIGSGASVQSGIPTGGTLVKEWIKELYERSGVEREDQTIETWATAKNLDIQRFDYNKADTFYPDIYKKRFQQKPEIGYSYLEKQMDTIEPSIGYSVLAKILANSEHRVVITTNFDNLVERALSIYTGTYPLVCGHESLVSFVRTELRRPLIAQIHRGLLLSPKSSPEETNNLAAGWDAALKNILKTYTPIVIGYGGNDGSLMGFLNNLKLGDINGGIWWCYWDEAGEPRDEIQNLVAKHDGCIIPILGFDEIMIQLNNVFGYPLSASEIEKQAKERASKYDQQLKTINEKINAPQSKEKYVEVREAFDETVEKQENWIKWFILAFKEPDPDKKDEIFQEAINKFPESVEILVIYANFLTNIRKSYDEAEKLYLKALELDPNNVTATANYATFLTDIRKSHDEAEKLYRKALELDPNDAINTGNYAAFLTDIRKEYDEAEKLYRKALELDPKNANTFANYACFLLLLDRFKESLKMIRRFIELNNSDINQFAGECMLYYSLICNIENRDDSDALARLKFIIENGFLRLPSNFDAYLEKAQTILNENDFKIYKAITEALLDESKVPELDTFPRWKKLKPVPLDVPIEGLK